MLHAAVGTQLPYEGRNPLKNKRGDHLSIFCLLNFEWNALVY